MSEKDNWKWQKELLIKRDKEHQKEIEMLNYIIDKQDRDIVALSNGNRKLNNIIKEVIDKVHDIYFRIDNIPQNHWIGIKLDTTNQGQELLEILDKENKE